MTLERANRPDRLLGFSILGQRIKVACADPMLRRIVSTNFGAMASGDSELAPDLEYRIDVGVSRPITLSREEPLAADDAGDLLYVLEKDITVEVQKRRTDLLFLHAAAIEFRGWACLLAGESGHGKSTTTWALLHHGYGYLTDELSPIDLDTMQVQPYPHAICLKGAAPGYPIGPGAIDLGRTVHVPPRWLPCTVVTGQKPLGAVLFVRYDRDHRAPKVRAMSSAEASARLYATALNPLAHPSHGLDAAVRLGRI